MPFHIHTHIHTHTYTHDERSYYGEICYFLWFSSESHKITVVLECKVRFLMSLG